MAAIAFDAADRMQQPAASQPGAFERPPSAGTMIGPHTPFQPLDPDIVSQAIPAFFIGRNAAGFWVAREAGGRSGGIFLLRSSAVEFAKAESAPSRCALVFPSEPFELDIDNRGNPLIAQIARCTGMVRRHLARFSAS